MRNASLRVSLAAVAAIVGAGFASGREILTFFTAQGGYSWWGVAITCAAIGFLSGMIAHFAVKTGKRSFPGIYGAEMGKPCEDAIQGLYGLLMLVTASVMMAAGAELGALALPIRHAWLMGMALTLIASAAAAYLNNHTISILGAVLVPAIVVFYVALALDGRPAPVTFPDRSAQVYGSFPLALIMGILYATLNTAMAGGVICLSCEKDVEPKKVGLYTGTFLALMLIPANAALLLAGPEIRALALPSVVLAARWGAAGFYACVGAIWCAVVTTLTAALGSLREQAVSLGVSRRPAAVIVCTLAILLAMIGFNPLVDIGYPLLGWSCAIALLALIAFL